MTATFLGFKLSEFYEFTEICIGYDYVEENNRKVYVMHFYRDDTKLCIIRMIRGAVKFHHATSNVLDLTISTSPLFSSDIKFDLFMRIRWIKNTPTGTKIIDNEEERIYREFAEARKNDETNPKGDIEKYFEKIELKLANSSKPNVLRTKLSRFLTLIKCLCDPSIGSYKNVPSDYEYNQQVKCYLSERTWESKKPRKNELDKHVQNFRDCQTLRWTNLSMENQNLDKLDAKNVITAILIDVKIFDSNQNLYPSFKNMFSQKPNFQLLKHLILESCNIEKLDDEFFEVLPTKLSFLNCNGNNIINISKKISKLIQLKDLELNDNKNLGDSGIPWRALPPRIEFLRLKKTNISVIPKEIQRLVNLGTLEVSSKNLKHIEWSEISDSIINLVIEGGDKLNEINLTGKSNLRTFFILQTGITDLDCSKLPEDLENFKMSNSNVKIFDAKKKLSNVSMLHLINNGVEEIVWENLSLLMTKLYIERNYLTSFGDSIIQLPYLRDILAADNKIKKISDNFWRLNRLFSLHLQYNEISALPKNFEMLSNLEFLDLSYNKFNFHETNLTETLWKRLPKSLKILQLSGNNLHTLPCSLKGYTFTDLQVDDCKLVNICPNLFSHREHQIINFGIEKNKKIQFLPFIPSKIYYPKDQNDEILEDSSNFTIFIDKEMLIGKSSSNWEPLYQFKKNKDLKLECSCCATCGNETDEAVVEQLMIMDFNLKILKQQRTKKEYEKYIPDSAIALLSPSSTEVRPAKGYTAGKWQTVVRTRLCTGCLKMIKSKIVESQKENSTKKPRTINNGNDEISIPLSSYLLFKNSNANDSALIAALNILDTMKLLKNTVQNSQNQFQYDLSNILRRKVYDVENLKQMTLQNISKNGKDAILLPEIMKLLDEEAKEFFQFSYEKFEFCMCETKNVKRVSKCLILSLTVGNIITSSESFETLLNRWYKYVAQFCFHCRMNTWQKPVIEIAETQKYLIVEINSWIKMAKNDSEQCPISSESFNVDFQEIFGKKWKLIAAIYSNSLRKYSTWRRFDNHWIVINEEEFRIVENLFSDFKDYKYFLFEKIEKDAKSDPILSELDQTMITVHKNVTFHTSSALLQPQIPEMTFPPPQQDQMEVDVSYPITSSEQDHYFNPNFVAASNQYIAPPQNYYNEFSYPQEDTSYANYPNPNYSSYYNQSNLPPQHDFHQTYQDPCETTDWDNQNGAQTNYQNYLIPQNYEYFPPGNNGEYGIYGLQQPTNVLDAQEQPMDISFYQTDEDSWFFNP